MWAPVKLKTARCTLGVVLAGGWLADVGSAGLALALATTAQL